MLDRPRDRYGGLAMVGKQGASPLRSNGAESGVMGKEELVAEFIHFLRVERRLGQFRRGLPAGRGRFPGSL